MLKPQRIFIIIYIGSTTNLILRGIITTALFSLACYLCYKRGCFIGTLNTLGIVQRVIGDQSFENLLAGIDKLFCGEE